jgi:hypothetical protein
MALKAPSMSDSLNPVGATVTGEVVLRPHWDPEGLQNSPSWTRTATDLSCQQNSEVLLGSSNSQIVHGHYMAWDS